MELLHPAAGLLQQVVRAARTLGETQAVPEGHRRLFIPGAASSDLAEGFPLGVLRRRAGPQAVDAPEAGEPSWRQVFGQEVRQGLVLPEIDAVAGAAGHEGIAGRD